MKGPTWDLGPHPLIGRFQPTRRLRIVLPSSTRWSFPARRIRQTQDQMYVLQGQTCLLSQRLDGLLQKTGGRRGKNIIP